MYFLLKEQKEYFEQEFRFFENIEVNKITSLIRNLNLYVDEEGLLRSKGRLKSFPERMPPSGGSGLRRGDTTPVRQRSFQVEGEGGGDGPQGSSPISPPPTTEGPSPSQGGGALSKKQRGEGPLGSYTSVGLLGLSLRGAAAFIEARLVTSVHPNPGPSRRGRRSTRETSRRERNVRRGERRRTRRVELARERRRRVVNSRGGRGVGGDVVTWNVQGMSVRGNNRDRMRRIVDRIIREGWEIVCLTEISAEREGLIWLGEDEFRVVFVHGMKSGVLLRGEALESWRVGSV